MKQDTENGNKQNNNNLRRSCTKRTKVETTKHTGVNPYSLCAYGTFVMHIAIYEKAHCTAFGPCSTRGITPSSLLICGEQK